MILQFASERKKPVRVGRSKYGWGQSNFHVLDQNRHLWLYLKTLKNPEVIHGRRPAAGIACIDMLPCVTISYGGL